MDLARLIVDAAERKVEDDVQKLAITVAIDMYICPRGEFKASFEIQMVPLSNDRMIIRFRTLSFDVDPKDKEAFKALATFLLDAIDTEAYEKLEMAEEGGYVKTENQNYNNRLTISRSGQTVFSVACTSSEIGTDVWKFMELFITYKLV